MTESNTNLEMDLQNRRSTRLVQAVPLTVTGVDALGRPFQERTSTLIINCHGCRYQSKHYVLKNMWVSFEVPHSEPGREPRHVRARVCWIQRPRTVRELFQIGVDLEVTGNIWGIAFPPADWFPFPEAAAGSEIPALDESAQIASLDSESIAEAPLPSEFPELPENNLRVLPLPGGADPSRQLAREVSRMVVEAKQQVQSTVRETAIRAVAAETRPLLAALQLQLKDAAEKSVETAVAAHIDRMHREGQQRMESERDASVAAMRAKWSRELDQRITEARMQIDSHIEEVERARRADFERQIQGQLAAAIEKLQSLSSSLGGNAGEVQTAIEQLRRNSEEAIAGELRRWQELTDQRASEAQARFAQLEQAANRLSDRIASETSNAESGWRGLLEADLAAASSRWNEKIETSLESAARQVADRLARNTEVSTQQLEEQLQQRINGMASAFSKMTAEAESTLGTLRASFSKETARGQAVLSQLQQSFEQTDAQTGHLSSLIQSGADELARRGEALLEAQSNEMNRRAESAVAGMAERLQPALESAGHETIERLANELEQRLGPQIARATEMLSKLALHHDQAEKALSEHQQRLWQASERSVQDCVARAKEVLAQVEREFSESARSASSKWVAELENKATETTHSTFEALFKSADWYEKKVQTQMQSTLEKGLEQASASLREKARDLSGQFANEMEHCSRNYVGHAQGQMDENAREAAERFGLQVEQTGEAAAANFTGRADQLMREQFEVLRAKADAAFEQNAARSEAHDAQVRSKLESHARMLAGEFQRALAQQAQQGLAQGKQELASQIDLAKDSLRLEAESLDRQVRSSLQSFGTQAMDEYKSRLETASNSWLLTTVSKLNQQSEALIDQLAASTENRLRATCGNVFAEVGETLRQRLAGLLVPATAQAVPPPSSDAIQPPEIKPEEQK